MTPEQWITLISNTGLGGFVALLVYLLIRKAGKFLASWGAPKVERLFTEHVDFLDVTKSAVKVIERTLTVQHGADIAAHDRTHKTLDSHTGKLDEIHSVVKRYPRPPSDSIPRNDK